MKIKLKDLNVGDYILGEDDKKYKVVHLTNIYLPKKMYRVILSNGAVDCSDDHLWQYYYNDIPYISETFNLFNEIEDYRNCPIGTLDGPKLLDIIEIEPQLSRCLTVENDSHLFKVYCGENEQVATHNCQFRVVCGRVESGASIMALGNTLGTTIDDKRKGAAIIKSQGTLKRAQIYYLDKPWLYNYFKQRGLDEFGYKDRVDSSVEDIDLSGEEEITSTNESVEIEFEGEKAEFDRRTQQVWEEL